GVEAELEARYKNGVRARISYAEQRTEYALTGVEISNSPRRLAKLNLVVPIFADKLTAGVELQYESAVKTLQNNRARSFLLTNVTLLSQKIYNGIDLSASVYNVFDQRYGDPGVDGVVHDIVPQDGRTFRLKLSCSF